MDTKCYLISIFPTFKSILSIFQNVFKIFAKFIDTNYTHTETLTITSSLIRQVIQHRQLFKLCLSLCNVQSLAFTISSLLLMRCYQNEIEKSIFYIYLINFIYFEVSLRENLSHHYYWLMFLLLFNLSFIFVTHLILFFFLIFILISFGLFISIYFYFFIFRMTLNIRRFA